MRNQRNITLRPGDYFKITLIGFALTALWQSLHTIILPLRLLDFAFESQKNTWLGLLTLSGLLLAMIVQPLAGAVSDRSDFRWGRRRPFILLGGVAAFLIIPGIGLASSLAALFLSYCFLQIATNVIQGPYQAFIPEMVPGGRRGTASGVKALLEITGGAALVYLSSIFLDRYNDAHVSFWLWAAIGLLAILLLAATTGTFFIVREKGNVASHPQTFAQSNIRLTLRQVIARPMMLQFLVSRLLICMAFATIQQFALYYLRDVIGMNNPAEATARFSIYAVGGMLLAILPASLFSDRIGRRTVSFAAGLLGAIGIIMIIFSREYANILWAAGIIGLAMGTFNTANWALATDLVAPGEEARYLGIANTATAGGAALARAIGPAIDYFNGQSDGLGYTFMLLVCMMYFLAGSALVLKVKKTFSASSTQR